MPFEVSEEFIRYLMDQNQQLIDQNNQLNENISEANKQIADLTAQIEALTQKIADLTEKKNKNSNNSSKPPSSDGLNKPNKKRSLREKTDKKQGGQPGHEGHHLEIIGEPDEVIELKPKQCQSCPNWENCKGNACIGEKRYRVDIKVVQTLERYDRIDVECPLCGKELQGEFPEDIKGEIQYGTYISALLVVLSTVGAVSTNRIREIFSAILNLPISKGTIVTMVSRCAKKAEPLLRTIKARLINAPILNLDETGTRVEGKLGWVHCACTTKYTLLELCSKRGFVGMEEMGVLPNFKGIAQHDCWKSYWEYDVKHAVCNSHILRELNGITENYPEQGWAGNFKALLKTMKATKDILIFNGETEALKYYVDLYERQYDEIIKKGYEKNPLKPKEPGKRGVQKKGKIRALIERLENYKAEVCLFFRNFNVEFDNNQAERDVRNVKVKTKVSGCFRSKDGLKDYLAVMSVVGTARKHGKNAFQTILNIFNGNLECVID